MVSKWSFAFTIKSLEDDVRRLYGGLEDVFRTSPGRRLDDVLKKGRRDFHFRPI